jgi:uncharacterized protein YhfF
VKSRVIFYLQEISLRNDDVAADGGQIIVLIQGDEGVQPVVTTVELEEDQHAVVVVHLSGQEGLGEGRELELIQHQRQRQQGSFAEERSSFHDCQLS